MATHSESDNFFSEAELLDICIASNIPVSSFTIVEPRTETNNFPVDSLSANLPGQLPLSPAHQSILDDHPTSPIDLSSKCKRSRGHNRINWKSEEQKNKRMKGESYLGYQVDASQGLKKRTLTKARASRTMGATCTSPNCLRTKHRHCSEFTDESRQALFNDFWQNMDWPSKKSYVRSSVDQIDPKFARTPGSTRKEKTNVYYLKLHGRRQQVCRQMFLSTLGLTPKEIFGWLSSKGSTAYRCEKSSPPIRKDSPHKTLATEYLVSLPKMPSHYCRAFTDKLYLEPIFKTFAELYNEYRRYCTEKSQAPVCKTIFQNLCKSLNISLFAPKKDQCDTCCAYRAKTISEVDYKAHQLKKDLARQVKITDKAEAEAGNCHAVCVDVQAVLLSPVLNASALYYKTKLMVHNYTIYNLKDRNASCFLWNESEGGLAASSFATCLINFLDEYFDDDKLPIVIFSDGCTNQNRNAVLSNALLQYAMKKKKVIYQKYLEKGHTQNEVDSVHATIERRMKNETIHLPTDYIKICETARKHPMPYNVRYMKFSDFRNYSSSENLRYCTIRPGNKKGDPTVTDIRQLRYNVNGTIDYKLSHADNWSPLPRKPKAVLKTNFPRLLKNPISITKRKYEDLQDLLPVLPEDSHQFYKNLPHL